MVLIVKNRKVDDWHASEEDVVELIHERIVEDDAGENRVEPIPKKGEDEDNVLVEHVADQVGVPSVALTPMEEKQILQKLELTNGIVA